MNELVLVIAAVPIAAIAGWAVVESARARGVRHQQPDPGLQRRVEDLAAAVVELRSELDDVAARQESDRQLLEERLEFTERLLTRARGEAGSGPP